MVVTTPSSISFYLNTTCVRFDRNWEYYGNAAYFTTSVNLIGR